MIAAQQGASHNAPMQEANTPTPVEARKSPEDERWKDRHVLLYNLHVDLRYYRKREWFFDKCEKLANLGTILGGTAVLASFQTAMPWLGLLIAVLGALPLVFSFADQRHVYRRLAEQAVPIITEIEQHVSTADITEDWLKVVKGKVGQLAAQEPPTLALLALVCEREQQIAENRSPAIPVIGWVYRFLAHFGNVPIPSRYLESPPESATS